MTMAWIIIKNQDVQKSSPDAQVSKTSRRETKFIVVHKTPKLSYINGKSLSIGVMIVMVYKIWIVKMKVQSLLPTGNLSWIK
jgi:hypothetical protein